MPSGHPPNADVRIPWRRFEAWTAIIIVVADQIAKQVVRMRLDYGDSLAVVPGFISLTRVHNTGAAFGMLDLVDFPFKTVVMTIVAAAALTGLALYGATLPAEQRLSRIGLAVVVGGAAGNLVDRIATGYVLDFVDVYWRGWHFWAFNVADAAITVGVALMILDLIGVGRQRVSRTI
jgi:signal peptidase II